MNSHEIIVWTWDLFCLVISETESGFAVSISEKYFIDAGRSNSAIWSMNLQGTVQTVATSSLCPNLIWRKQLKLVPGYWKYPS